MTEKAEGLSEENAALIKDVLSLPVVPSEFGIGEVVRLLSAARREGPTQPPVARAGGGETWHERLKRLVSAKDYAAALALLRAPAAPNEAEALRARLKAAEEIVRNVIQLEDHFGGMDARLFGPLSTLARAYFKDHPQ